jgi:ribosomal protein L11 methyltransferase
MSDLTHLRWRLEVPHVVEEAFTDWLVEGGASATYREADPPYAFYAYFPPDVDSPDPAGLAAFPGTVLLEQEGFGDEDWLAKSREGFGSFEVGRTFWVKPLWEATPGPETRTTLVVNPGLAFGTGGHETTRLCLELLEELSAKDEVGGPILDIGAGTGILALGAHLLGGKHITAFDIDPDCGPAMTELIELNAGVLNGTQPFASFVGTLDDPKVAGPFQGLLANILLVTIQDLLPRMAEIAAHGAWLVASGIMGMQEDEALVSLVTEGFKPVKVVREGEWIAILARRS